MKFLSFVLSFFLFFFFFCFIFIKLVTLPSIHRWCNICCLFPGDDSNKNYCLPSNPATCICLMHVLYMFTIKSNKYSLNKKIDTFSSVLGMMKSKYRFPRGKMFQHRKIISMKLFTTDQYICKIHCHFFKGFNSTFTPLNIFFFQLFIVIEVWTLCWNKMICPTIWLYTYIYPPLLQLSISSSFDLCTDYHP